ncbi:MAG: hypothetical protein EBT24_04560, partial [Betaproteobacteria bacterium]|nr:hypothetical protein [Betaproteobacteria bacterium]
IYVHAITDGRDCSPTSGREFIQLNQVLAASCGGCIQEPHEAAIHQTGRLQVLRRSHHL